MRLGIEKISASARGQFQLFGGTLPDPFRVAVAPDLRRQDSLMPLIDVVTDGLSDQMIGDRKSG